MESFRVSVQDDRIELESGQPEAGAARGRSEGAGTVSFRDIVVVLSSEATGQLELHVIYLVASDDATALPTVDSLFLDVSPEWISQQPKSFRDLVQPAIPSARISIIVNSKAGPDSARIEAFLKTILEPLLQLTSTEHTMHWTQGVGDAGRIGREILRGKQQATIAVLGGDGTVHELLNGVLLDEANQQKAQLDLVLLPFGTANALYYSLFPPESLLTPLTSVLSPYYSLVSSLRRSTANSFPPKSLILAHNSFSDGTIPKVITSVVTSAALHASILLDAEELRESHPGVERFKIAAMKNVTTWWDGRLILQDASLYNPATKSFLPIESSAEGSDSKNKGELVCDGPFSYFVSALVDRFEPNFIVAPLRSAADPTTPSIDIVLIRPLRDTFTQSLLDDGRTTPEAVREQFVKRIWGCTGGMYDGGKHVDMRFEGGDEDLVVEYYRCGSYTWTPTPSDDKKSNLVCLDGALQDLGRGGSLSTRAMSGDEADIRVWR